MISYRMGKKELESGAGGGKLYSQDSKQRDKGNLEREVMKEKYVQDNTRGGCCSQSPNNLILHG